MSDESNRRQTRRYRRRLPVRLWNDALEAKGFTVDISNGGMLIETQRLPEIGDRLHADVTIEGTSYLGECLVVRKRPRPLYAHAVSKPAMGVRFIRLIEAIRGSSEEGSAGEQTAERRATPRDEPPSVEPNPAVEPPRAEAPPAPPQRPTLDLGRPKRLKAAFERDLQFGGVFVETTEPLEVGSEIAISVVLPPPNGAIPVRGTVVRVSDDPPGAAVQLLDLELVRARLEEILELLGY